MKNMQFLIYEYSIPIVFFNKKKMVPVDRNTICVDSKRKKCLQIEDTWEIIYIDLLALKICCKLSKYHTQSVETDGDEKQQHPTHSRCMG